jgi:rare lipoprotein A
MSCAAAWSTRFDLEYAMRNALLAILTVLMAGVIESRPTTAQAGLASYYWQRQRLASGGWFNPHAMTAAHKRLPFGTKVRVTHASTGRVVVTINDRGPYVAPGSRSRRLRRVSCRR